MGAYTTKRMTENQVLTAIIRELPNATNEQLEKILDIFLDKSLYNCMIVPEGMEDK